jgi:hypothetical protein
MPGWWFYLSAVLCALAVTVPLIVVLLLKHSARLAINL